MGAISYLFRRRWFRLTTVDRNTGTWDGGSAGLIPLDVVVHDKEQGQTFVGNATPENTPTSGYAGGIIIGPELGGGWKTLTSTLTGTQNNFNPTDFPQSFIIKFQSASNISITGLAAPDAWSPAARKVDGHFKFLFNDSSVLVNLINASGSSTTTNQFSIGANLTLRPGDGVWVWYDGSLDRWRLGMQTKTTRHYHNGNAEGGLIYQSFGGGLLFPATTDKPFLFYTQTAITINQAVAVIAGSSSPSITFNVKYSNTFDESGTGNTATKLWTSDKTVTSLAGTTYTSFDNPSIPASKYVWMNIPSINAGVVDQLSIQVTFTQDFV